MKARNLFIFVIIFSLLFSSIIADDTCPDGMRKTYVDDMNMRQHGSARRWLAAVCFFQFPGSLWFSRQVLIEPNFEVHLKAAVDAIDIVESSGEQKIYGFTIVISGNRNTISGLEGRTVNGGTSSSLTFTDIGYNNFLNALIIEFDFVADRYDPDQDSFSVRYCDTTCHSYDNLDFVMFKKALSKQKYIAGQRNEWDFRLVYKRKILYLYSGPNEVIYIGNFDLEEKLGTNVAYVGFTGFMESNRGEINLMGTFMCEDNYVITRMQGNFYENGMQYTTKDYEPGQTINYAFSFINNKGEKVPHTYGYGIWNYTFFVSQDCETKVSYTISKIDDYTLLITTQACKKVGEHSIRLNEEIKGVGKKSYYNIVPGPMHTISLVGHDGIITAVPMKSDTDVFYLNFGDGNSGDFIIKENLKIVLDFKISDQYGNKVSITSPNTLFTLKKVNDAGETSNVNSNIINYILLEEDNEEYYQMTISVTEIGTYQIEKNDYMEKPIKFNVIPGEASPTKSICYLNGYSSAPTVNIGITLSYKCFLRDSNGNEIPIKTFRQNSKYEFSCSIDKQWPTIINYSPTKIDEEQSFYNCIYVTSEIGNFAFNGNLILKSTKETTKIMSQINQFYVRGKPSEYTIKKIFEPSSKTWIDFDTNTIITYSPDSQGLITAIDFADVGGNILISSYSNYPDEFNLDNLKVYFNSPHDLEKSFEQPIKDYYTLNGKTYIGLFTASRTHTDNLIRKSSFKYNIKFTYLGTEKSAAIQYILNIGQYTTCFHDLYEKSTIVNFDDKIELLTGGEEKKIGNLVLRTKDNYLYNYDIGTSKIQFKLSGENNIKFKSVSLSIEGTYDIYASSTQDFYGTFDILINNVNVKTIPIISEPSQACQLEWVNTEGIKHISTNGKELYYEYDGEFDKGNLVINFKLKDKYDNPIEKEDYFTKFSDISSEEYGTDTNYFSITYNVDSDKKYYTFRDNIPYENRQHGWIFTMREKTCNYKYYVRYDGKKGGSPLSENNSYFSLLNTEIYIKYDAFVDVIYKDINNKLLGLQEGKLNDMIERTTVKAKNEEGHEEILTFNSITSNFALRFKSTFSYSGIYTITATLDNKTPLNYENSNKLTVIDNIYNMMSSKFMMITDTIADLYIDVRVTIDNKLYIPVFKLDFYSKDNVKTNYDKNHEFSLKMSSPFLVTHNQEIYLNVDKSSEQFIQFTFPSNETEHFSSLGKGDYKLYLKGGDVTLTYQIYLKGENATDYSNDLNYDISQTEVKPTTINGIAGKTYSINVEFRAQDGLRWNYKVDLQKFIIKYSQSDLTSEDITIKTEAGPKKGQVTIFVTQKKAKEGVNTLEFIYEEKKIPTTVALTIKCAELNQLKKIEGPIYGNVINPPIIKFKPVDSYGNLYTDLFTSSTTQEYLNSLTVGTSKDKVLLTSNNYISEGQFLIVQYISTISTDVVVTSDYFEGSIGYRIFSGPIDLDTTYAELKTTTTEVGGENVLLISPKDKYNNIIDGLNESDLKQFETFYQKVGVNNREVVDNCYLIERSSSDDLRILLAEEEIDNANYTHIECKVNITIAGFLQFLVEYQGNNILCKPCSFIIDATKVYFFNTKTFYTNKGYNLSTTEKNEVEIVTTPIFELTFYDIYMNEIDEYFLNEMKIKAIFEGADIKLCLINSGQKKAITICPSSNGDDNENKFKYLTNGDEYKMKIQDENNLSNLIIYPIKITGGASDGSSAPVDLANTEFEPNSLTLIAGEEGIVKMTLKTALSFRHNYWYPDANEKIKIKFDNDGDTCSSNVERADLPGQYYIKVKCTKTTVLNYFSVYVDGKIVEKSYDNLKVKLTITHGLAYYLEVENIPQYTVSSDKYTWKTNPTNDDSITFSFKLKDEYQNYIKDNLIETNQFTISSETYGSGKYYSIQFDKDKYNYKITDQINEAITKHTWNVIVVKSNRKYSFIYTKVPGAPSTEKSYWTIDKESYIMGETSTVYVYLIDKLGVNLGTLDGKLDKEKNNIKVKTQNRAIISNYNYDSTSSNNIVYSLTYTAVGNYEVSVEYDNKSIGEKKNINIAYQKVDLKNSKLYYNLDNTNDVLMSLSTQTNINNLLTYPFYKFILYTDEGKRITTYDKSIEVTCIMYHSTNQWEMDVEKFDDYLKITYKEGFQEKFSKLPLGMYYIQITYDNEILRYPLYLLGEKDVSASSDYDLEKIYIKPTEIEAIAGEEKEIEIEFRASDGLRWNYEINLLSFGVSNSYGLKNEQLQIQKIKGEKNGQMKLKVRQTTSTQGQPNNILTLTYASKKISQTISLNIQSSTLKTIVYKSGCEDGTVINPPTLKFYPFDEFGNICHQLFDPEYYSKEKLQEITKGLSKEGHNVISNVYAEDGYLYVQYGCQKVTTITVSSNYCDEQYTYKLISGPIDPSETTAKILEKEKVEAGDINTINIYPKDKYGNDVTSLSDNDISNFEVHYNIDKDSSVTITKYCQTILGNINYIKCEANITKSGDVSFGVDYNDKSIQCEKCEFKINPSSIYFLNTRVLNQYTNKEMSKTSINTLTITSEPKFLLTFYDRFKNAIINENEIKEFNVNTKLEVTDVKLCIQNIEINNVMNKNSTLCKSVNDDENEEKWKYIPNGNGYQYIVYTQTENLIYPVQIIDGYSDGDSGSIDISKTYINPSTLTLTAGIEGKISLELRTKDNVRKNYWFTKDTQKKHLDVKFPDSVKNCNSNITRGEKPGQYSISFNCTEKHDTFQSIIVVEKTDISQKISMKVIPNEPVTSKLYKLDGSEITYIHLGSVSVEDKLQIINKLFDKYGNLITDIDFDLSILKLRIAPSISVKNHEYSIEPIVQNEGEIIITVKSTYAGNHMIVGALFPLKNYTITFTPGKPSADNSLLQVSEKEAFVGESVKIYITPYDKYSNLIDAKECLEKNYAYQVKYTNEGSSTKIDMVNKEKDTYESIDVISYPGKFYVRGYVNFYGYLDSLPIKCVSCRIDIKSKDINFESSLVMRYESSKADYEILKNGAAEKNAKEEPVYRLYPRDEYLNEIDYIPNDKLSNYTAYLESQSQHNIIYNLKLNNKDSNNPPYAEFVINDDTSHTYNYSSLVGGLYNLYFQYGTKSLKYNITLLGDGTGGSNEDADFQKTHINEQNLKFTAGETGYLILELRTANEERHNSWGYTQNDYKIEVKSCNEADKTFSYSQSRAGLRGVFQIIITTKKANTYPKLNTCKLKIYIDGNVIQSLEPTIEVSPNILVKTTILESYYEDISKNVLKEGNTDNNYIFEVASFDQYNNLAETKQEIIGLKVNYKGGEEITKATSENEIDTGFRKYSVPATKTGTYIVSTSKSGSQGIYLKNEASFLIRPGAIDITKTVVRVKSSPIQAGENPSIIIIAYDKYGNTLEYQSYIDKFNVIFIDANSQQLSSISKYDTGTQKVYYTSNKEVTIVGNTKVDVTYNNKEKIDTSKTIIEIYPGDPYPPNSILSHETTTGTLVEYLDGNSFVIDTTQTLKLNVTLYDKYKNYVNDLPTNAKLENPIMSGNTMKPITFTVIKNTGNFDLDFNENADYIHIYQHLVKGKYDLSFKVSSSLGEKVFHYNLEIINGDGLHGNGDYEISKCLLSPKDTTFVAGNYQKFTLELRTEEGLLYNNDIDIKNDINITTNNNDESFKSSISKTGTDYGIYTITIYSEKKGEYNLNVVVKDLSSSSGQKKSVNSVKYKVTPDPIPFKNYTEIINQPDSTVDVDKPITIIFNLFDKYKNKIENTDNIVRTSYFTLINNDEPYSYTSLSFVSRAELNLMPKYPPKTMTLNLLYNNGETTVFIFKNDINITVQSSIDFMKTQIISPNKEKIYAGQILEMWLYTLDKSYKCLDGGDLSNQFKIEIIGPLDSPKKTTKTYKVIKTKITEDDKSECNNEYKIDTEKPRDIYKIAGNYIIRVMYGGNSLIAQYNQVCYPLGYSEEGFYLKYNFNPDTISILDSPSFTITGTDEYGNIVKDTLYNDINISFTYNNKETVFETKQKLETQQGTLNYQIEIHSVGSHQLHLYYKQKEITKVNDGEDLPRFTILTGPCFAENNSHFDLTPLNDTEVSLKAYFTFYCYDKFGNKITKGGERFNVKAEYISGDNIPLDDAKVVDNGDGSYNVEFVPTMKGVYLFNILKGKEKYGEEVKFTLSEFKCTGENTVLCPNKKLCVKNILECIPPENRCNSTDKPFYCVVNGEKKCTKSQTDCDCPPNYEKCPIMKYCVPSDRKDMCPIFKTYPMNCLRDGLTLNFDGICRMKEIGPNQRVCPIGKILCADLSCRDNYDQCVKTEVRQGIQNRCIGQQLVDMASLCPSSITCSSEDKVVCPNGECVSNEIYCPALNKCNANYPYLCQNNICAESFETCPISVSCGTNKLLCSDNICRESC